MKNKPSYALASVDNALLLLQMLRDHGNLRVSEAAEELGIARSTAHRLLSMLVYRDFAMQDDRRTYVPGPALAASQVVGRPLQQFRRCLAPHLDALCERVQETVNLIVRVGIQTRFLASVESTQVLHVGDRQGTILPAHLTSGGKALLAELEAEQLERLYTSGTAASTEREPADVGDSSLSGEAWSKLLRELDSVRTCGYSLNIEGTEAGVSALGACVYDAAGEALGAVSISAPSARFGQQRIPVFARELKAMIADAQADLRSLPQW
ncbi:IclR family transcriptional regulator [Haloactinomyces albus]|uniref:DNA-binding IclR family transcriptional regulator n=1 Tax=Haloactinomyces albus TaxID=1352928 RepID=A0AAE3ZGB3_9ACTN|nr:IclR family transcriptional regulator [Haloactinomyces albus]MDR7304401.1 DNA-binding IclR family transcriptional regulator [Haloactinomyces albus]